MLARLKYGSTAVTSVPSAHILESLPLRFHRICKTAAALTIPGIRSTHGRFKVMNTNKVGEHSVERQRMGVKSVARAQPFISAGRRLRTMKRIGCCMVCATAADFNEDMQEGCGNGKGHPFAGRAVRVTSSVVNLRLQLYTSERNKVTAAESVTVSNVTISNCTRC